MQITHILIFTSARWWKESPLSDSWPTGRRSDCRCIPAPFSHSGYHLHQLLFSYPFRIKSDRCSKRESQHGLFLGGSRLRLLPNISMVRGILTLFTLTSLEMRQDKVPFKFLFVTPEKLTQSRSVRLSISLLSSVFSLPLNLIPVFNDTANNAPKWELSSSMCGRGALH